MDLVPILVAIIGSGALSALITAYMNRRVSKADVTLKEAQAGSEIADAANTAVAMMHAQMNDLAARVTALNLKVDTLETLLQRSDYALTSLAKHPGIKKDYPEPVERAIRIRRGREAWDTDTPLMFDTP